MRDGSSVHSDLKRAHPLPFRLRPNNRAVSAQAVNNVPRCDQLVRPPMVPQEIAFVALNGERVSDPTSPFDVEQQAVRAPCCGGVDIVPSLLGSCADSERWAARFPFHTNDDE